MEKEQLRNQLEKIRKHLEEVEYIVNDIPQKIQNKIMSFHIEYDLVSIARWGEQNTSELIDDIDELIGDNEE